MTSAPLRIALSGLAVALLLVGFGLGTLLASPLDLDQTIPLPARLAATLQRDGVAYRGHRWLGTALELAGFPADAVGLQWYKAAAHARTPAEVDRARRHFAAARARSASQGAFDASLCRFVGDGPENKPQGELLQAAPLTCRAAARDAVSPPLSPATPARAADPSQM